MSTRHDSVVVPSLHDQFETRATGHGFADEQPADAFPPDAELTPEEEEEMRQQYLARLAEAPAGYRDAPCVHCGAALYVPDGAEAVCPRCDRANVAGAA